ncbi:MAG: L-aspartate oxidase [Thermoplasmata archaeon]|nr:L-aspartate oxidase [Thermoplasmata archaeon]
MPRPSDRPLIVGSGIAGLYVAIRCHELGLRPTLVTKATLEESNTRYAQGGIAAAIGPGDSPAQHLADTVRAGAGLVDRSRARILVGEAPARIADLVRLGVPFDTIDGHVALGREAAHHRSRIVHAGGDATGLHVEETLKHRALDLGIDLSERTQLLRVTSQGPDGVRAVVGRSTGGSVSEIETGAVVLATGGAGSLYSQSSNPWVATGDGIAVAALAGALLADMEFVQFHPTVFAHRGAPRYLMTEAIRGEGALLRNRAGERFLPRYHREAEMAPRDIVSRAIVAEMERTRTDCVYLDATGIPREKLWARFPTICHFLQQHGIDPTREGIPVTPAAHFLIGGVATDAVGRSSLRGLWACGEVAATGVHGANRLASNSLLEGVVFGERVARHLRSRAWSGPPRPRRLVAVALPDGDAAEESLLARREIRRRLWHDVGILRNGPALEASAERFQTLLQRFGPEDPESAPLGGTAHAALVALCIAQAAHERTESRGVHYRTDFPRPRPAWALHIGVEVERPQRSKRANR